MTVALGLVLRLGEPVFDPPRERLLEVDPRGRGGDRLGALDVSPLACGVVVLVAAVGHHPVVLVGVGAHVGVAGANHLHGERRVERFGDGDVGRHPVGDDVGRVVRDVEGEVVRPAAGEKQLREGAQATLARRADVDALDDRLLAGLPLRRVRASNREIDGMRRGQPLGGLHERVGLVLVAGALGLPQQRGDARQCLVAGHTALLLCLGFLMDHEERGHELAATASR